MPPRGRRPAQDGASSRVLQRFFFRAALVAPPALLLSGCTLLPLGGGPAGSPGGSPSPMDPELRECRVVFHCHSYLSHDSDGTIEEIAAAARGLGADVVVLTDHYEPGNIARSPRRIEGGVLFIPGVELRLPGGASLLAAGVRSDFEKGADTRDLMRRFAGEGAFLVAGHVERLPPESELEGFDGIEIYNLHAQFEDPGFAGTAFRFLFYPADAFFEAAITTPRENLELWDRELLAGRRLTPLAGHDAHANVKVFGPLGGTIGTYPELFRLFSTRVLVRELSEEGVLDALHRGRAFVVFDYLGDATGFSMRYGPLAAGRRWAIPGDEVPLEPEARIEVRLETSAELRLIRDGEILAATEASELDVPVERPGVYRLEAYRRGRLWIAASPIWIRGPEATSRLGRAG